MNIMQNSENEKPATTEDWIVYSELRQRVKDLISSSLVDTFGGAYTLQIIRAAMSKSGLSQSELFSDYETFVMSIEDVFGTDVKNSILRRAGLDLTFVTYKE